MTGSAHSYSAKKRGAWLCPTCKNRCKTLAGINRHLYRKHNGEGYGIYRTTQELDSAFLATVNGKTEKP